ncbi:VPLPA-CTERM sorting domain-containing protein [Marinicaulis aureus]|uniref:VPLPA-CTERM sorting domain-containing protein n=1 Tax=Hyphococcus aureus TaxID=2666033 RepID=A0ABW1KV18_9PROT
MKFGALISITFMAVGLSCMPAKATLVNFVDYAASNPGHATGDLIDFGDDVLLRLRASQNIVATNDGFTGGGSLDVEAYLDDPAMSASRGAGVCRSVVGNPGFFDSGFPCENPADTAVDGADGEDEALLVIFWDYTYLNALSFRGIDNQSLNDSDGLVEFYIGGLDASVGGITTFSDLVLRAMAGEFGRVFQMAFGYVNTEFYLESLEAEAISDVPLPAGLPLLLSGLAGLGWATRRKTLLERKPQL